MHARKKPAKPPPRAAEVFCPGQDFQARHEARLQLLPHAGDAQAEFARELRAFELACARSYWLALLRD